MKFVLVLAVLTALFSVIHAAREGGKQDWFIYLERGKPAPADKEAAAAMQQGHLANFGRLHGEGKLFAAGPMRDPSGLKRGIVWVKADSRDELMSYFQPDQYVRDGYMTVNAAPCLVNKELNSKDIDPTGIEEVRIIQISRPARILNESEKEANRSYLQGLVDSGRVGAWYTLETGDVAEVLFWRTTDSHLVKRSLNFYPSARNGDAHVSIWAQWLGKGVVK